MCLSVHCHSSNISGFVRKISTKILKIYNGIIKESGLQSRIESEVYMIKNDIYNYLDDQFNCTY
jgi:hypothetical protein